MLRKLDRIAIVLVSAAVGLQAIIPGWQIMTDGSVYGFKLPTSWLSSAWPFPGFNIAGLVLLVVVGWGSLVTACIAAFSEKAGFVAALLMGFVLVGWIGGELVVRRRPDAERNRRGSLVAGPRPPDGVDAGVLARVEI